ncbi:MAG: hypothetical protein AAGF96_05955 [Bacteroidota bacterium]
MKVELNIPNTQEEITVGRYLDWIQLDFEGQTEQFQRERVIQIFCGVPLELIYKIKRSDFLQISSHIFAVLQEKQEFKPRVKIGPVEYGFIPNLNEITTGEYIDLDIFFSEKESLHKAMAVLYRPIITRIGESYRIKNYKGMDKSENLMKKLPLSVANGAMLFFYRLSKKLLRITPNYLRSELNKQNSKQLELLLAKNGVGINTYIHSLEEIISNLSGLLNQNYYQPFNSSPFQKITTTA